MQTLNDIMTKEVKSCIAEDNIYEAAVKMKAWDVGAIPVVSDDHLIGMVTDRDLIVRAMAEKRPGSTRITEVMSSDVVTATPDTTVDEAAEMMAQHQIRRLPIVEGTKLVGIVALRDLAIRHEYEHEAEHALEDISAERDGHHPASH
ncbi:CBS domain-containing protein [Caldalkalibacillus salinus]|uniref:CBS domain-containing protein n=1 Tax=Caldalkalibacillus salinus TaxID=2803787 RepID=UPI00192293FA